MISAVRKQSSPPPKWFPDGDMIIYSVNSCGRGAPGGTLHLISVDGTYHEVLLPYTNNNPDDFVVSPDGNYIIYGVGNDFEIMTLAQPIPEFEIIAGLVLAVSMIPIILARNKLILR